MENFRPVIGAAAGGRLPHIVARYGTRLPLVLGFLVLLFFGFGPAPAQAAAQVTTSPAVLQQNQTLIVHIAGFTPLSLMHIALDGAVVSKLSDYSDDQGALDKAVLIPSTLSDGTHQIVVSDVYNNRASVSFVVQGAYAPATMVLDPTSGPRGQTVWITGQNWQKRSKTVTLQSPDGANQILSMSDGCYMDFVPGDSSQGPKSGQYGCAPGEMKLIVTIPENVSAGSYMISISDGLAHAEAPFRVTGALLPPPQPPQPTPVQPNPPQQYPVLPNLPLQPNPPPQSPSCDPNIPLYQQPGCGGTTSSNPNPFIPGPAQQQGSCNPNVPRYQQPGCSGSSPNVPVSPDPVQPNPTPSQGGGQVCNPNIPRYSQPGCVP
ncbi:MAG TPA: hypothetical protein VMV54_04185 [Acidocella sp.]|nr:hypothetical protein [Acidocella sp.]